MRKMTDLQERVLNPPRKRKRLRAFKADGRVFAGWAQREIADKNRTVYAIGRGRLVFMLIGKRGSANG